MVIDRTPQVGRFPINLQKNFVQIPFVASFGSTVPEFVGILLPELQAPLAHGFIRDHDAAFSQQLFHIPIAEGEAKIEPNSMTDDLGGKAEAFVRRRSSGACVHAPSMP